MALTFAEVAYRRPVRGRVDSSLQNGEESITIEHSIVIIFDHRQGGVQPHFTLSSRCEFDILADQGNVRGLVIIGKIDLHGVARVDVTGAGYGRIYAVFS